jgi:hypothetical protein
MMANGLTTSMSTPNANAALNWISKRSRRLSMPNGEGIRAFLTGVLVASIKHNLEYQISIIGGDNEQGELIFMTPDGNWNVKLEVSF